MASKYYYFIIHSVLFIVFICITQVSSDYGGYYDTQEPAEDAEFIIVPLSRVKRQTNIPPTSFKPEVKPEVPSEDKTKTTKKSLVIKPSAGQNGTSTQTKTGSYKKEVPSNKLVNTTNEPHDETQQSHNVHDQDHNHEQEHSSSEPLSSSESPVENSSSSTAREKVSGPPITNISMPENTEIQISKIFENKIFNMDAFNETLREHNITSQQEDHHLFYNSSFMVNNPEEGKKYWVDMDNQKDVKISDTLSQAHRRAVTVKLSFDFPFYGHLIRNITIATGGFLYTGEYVHSWLAATQYIAPLMANFDTSLSNDSFVKYLDNGTSFTVQWENVVLQEKPQDGHFTFQCTLYPNGNIVFVYRHVSVIIENIEDSQHPVKVGLSDAYIIDRNVFFVRRKTIYEYHRVHFNREEIKNWTVIVLNALETCVDMKDCQSCLTRVPRFDCNWCSNRCSNGMDRHRQDWLMKSCNKAKILTLDECPFADRGRSASESHPNAFTPANSEASVSIGIAGIMGILFIICFMMGAGIWLFYAYRNPHTAAGQFLIRYRPSQWSWRRGEARYTAATIHM